MRDFVWLLAITSIGAIASLSLDLPGRFTIWGYAHEANRVSELPIIAVFVVAAMGVFGWRRWREALQEIAGHGDILKQLAAREEETGSLLAASPDLLFRLDQAGTFIFVKEAPDRPMLDELIIMGTNVGEVLSPHLAEQIMGAIRQIHAGSRQVDFRYELAGRADIGIWEARCVPIVGSDDVIMISRDVTNSESQAEALRDLNQLFRAAFEEARIGMALTSPTGQFTQVNPALCEMAGYSAEELLAMHFVDITHPDDRAGSLASLHTLASGGKSAPPWEKRYLHSDGHVVWAQVSVVAIRDANGELTNTLAQMQDVTGRREAQAALAASEQRWKHTFEAAATGVALVNLDDGRFVTVNQAGCDLLGHSQQELSTMTIGDVTHPEDRQESATRFRQVVTGEIPTSRAKLRYLRGDNTTRHALVSTALVRTPEGVPLHLVAHVVDVTDQVRAEQRLVDLLASKDELIASVSHELRTPLTAVVGYAQMLNDEVSGLSAAERKEMIESIASQGTDLTNIIEDLLVEARADIGALTVARVLVDLHAQTAQVLETLQHDTDGRHIELTGPPTTAVADPARVRQILRNLVTNAIRYGGDHIGISVDNGGPSVRLVVSDNGPGVPPEEQDRIFEPYHRAHTRKGLTASVGLGLTVSRKLARLMGGDLTYRRETGESVFQLDLPKPN